jgi:hypothetical protein
MTVSGLTTTMTERHSVQIRDSSPINIVNPAIRGRG